MKNLKKYLWIGLTVAILAVWPWWTGIMQIVNGTTFDLHVKISPIITGILICLCVVLIVVIWYGLRETILGDQEPSYKPGDTLENVNKPLEREQMFLSDKETNTFAWGNPSPTPK